MLKCDVRFWINIFQQRQFSHNFKDIHFNQIYNIKQTVKALLNSD